MRVRSIVPWLLVSSISMGGIGIGPLLTGGSRANAQAIKEPGWPPPDGAACKPTKTDDDEAKTLFGLAAKAEDTSNYTDAIKYYKDAYKRACNRHLLLKNLGRAYEKDAQYGAAVEAYKLYRQRGKPTGEELDQIDQKIANLSKKVSPGTEPTPTTTSTTPVGATATDTAPTATAPPTTTAPTSTAPTSGGGGGGGNIPIAPLVVTGIGGVLLIGGSIVWIGANGRVGARQDDFLAGGCNDPERKDKNVLACGELKSEGEKAARTRTLGVVAAAVGGAAVVGGLIWFFMERGKSSSASTTSLRVTPGPGQFGLGLAGTF